MILAKSRRSHNGVCDGVKRLILGWLIFTGTGMPPLSAVAADPVEDVLEGFEDAPATPGDAAPETKTDALDNVLEGFETPSDDIAATDVPAKEDDNRWQWHGYTSVSSTANFAHKPPAPGEPDYRGLSRMRVKWQPEFGQKYENWDVFISGVGFYDAAYEINDRDDYPHNVLETYEDEVEWHEVYVRGQLTPHWDIKLGRQIVVWGKSDNIRVTDIINPLDNREPGMVDIENLRLPVWMTRSDIYWRNWQIQAMAIHRLRFPKLPVFGSEFFPGDQPLPPGRPRHHGGSNTEYAFAVLGTFTGWDASLHFARVFNDLPHIIISDGRSQTDHARITMTGAAANLSRGNFLFKGESAYFSGLRYAALDKTFRRVDTLVGVEYAGFTNTQLALEAVNQHLFDYDDRIDTPPFEIKANTYQWALRGSRTLLRERLELLGLMLFNGEAADDGGVVRVQADYELKTALHLTGGIVFYESGSGFFTGIGDNDRLFIELRYDY